jgi:hypothetical protein
MYAHEYLVKARHDELMRAAAQYRLAGQVRRSRGPRPHHVMAAPVRRLARLRPHKVAA